MGSKVSKIEATVSLGGGLGDALVQTKVEDIGLYLKPDSAVVITIRGRLAEYIHQLLQNDELDRLEITTRKPGE
jgi:hypothetical protein